MATEYHNMIENLIVISLRWTTHIVYA